MLRKYYVATLLGAMLMGSLLHANYSIRMTLNKDGKKELVEAFVEIIQKDSLEHFRQSSMLYFSMLDYNDLCKLRSYCWYHARVLAFALELHTIPGLYDLFKKMQQEVDAMPTQLLVRPGYVLTPNLDQYLWQRYKDLETNSQLIDVAVQKRAIELLSDLRSHVILNHVLAIKKIMRNKTDEQINDYMRSQEEHLNGIHEIIEEELCKWEYFLNPDAQDIVKRNFYDSPYKNFNACKFIGDIEYSKHLFVARC